MSKTAIALFMFFLVGMAGYGGYRIGLEEATFECQSKLDFKSDINYDLTLSVLGYKDLYKAEKKKSDSLEGEQAEYFAAMRGARKSLEACSEAVDRAIRLSKSVVISGTCQNGEVFIYPPVYTGSTNVPLNMGDTLSDSAWRRIDRAWGQ
jgi:hypothetical protein